MAIYFKPEETVIIEQVYETLPEPKPAKEDFFTYVFEQSGIENVKTQDPQHVIRAAVGASEKRDRRKSYNPR